jgi:ubiquinone/menaquinone biosynthesis C-methylase UbiE
MVPPQKIMPMTYVEIQRRYNYILPGDHPLMRDEIQALAAILRECPPRSILDVGCRYGLGMNEFMQRFPKARVMGVDIVPEFAEDEDMQVMDACDLKFADDEFDLVYSSHTLEHCYDIDKAIDEHFRVALRWVYVIVPLEDERGKEHDKSHYYCECNPVEWARLLDRPKWRLLHLLTRERNDIVMLWGREEA